MTTKASKSESATIVYLRGLAAFGVVLYHVREDLWVGWNALRGLSSASSFDKAVAWLSIPTPFLGSGVILFFLLSGFCISLPYVGNNARKLNLEEYAIRRFLRIYPPYLIAIIFTLIIEFILLKVYALPVAPYTSYLANVFMVQNYTTGALTSNGALWTLPVELELYIAFPLVFYLLKNWGDKALIIITGIISLIALSLFISGQFWLGSDFAMYWVVWCAGVLLAREYANGTLNKPSTWLLVTAVIAVGTAVVLQVCGVPSPYLELLFGFFYLMSLWLGIGTEHRWNKHIPRGIVKAMNVLGTCSFSLYLIHKPVFRLIGIIWVSYFGSKPVNFLIPVGFSILMVCMAWGFYLLIEAPTHALAKKLSRTKKQQAVVIPLNK
ncbi:Peptidoglycan/LPS O-acetylase OafA/YrhL, contains acyltransferase and SGNH-hydrolase domains [Mucilaginibacter gossypiicola]|uniref:Peptidoglycan/LPS O-acetylase OafA/YrhL, contains acyltransferase and SGNH-hydrolase domains n=1 Tax=Mucilaginibacter gossypiicola TaxID=551995 RepID=A0A1H8G5U5_9SPHI|nr:acyltransferase [Mucilaginibacter gossypiicola]SEN39120.1 Peptidoglycan/LPS O-acetylase OafA/YrhL, contains acyltransferase and SGNH-hydrolase domains [Mucilaginibacter gossypiicola]